MKIERVHVRAFGPLSDQQLEFAPGMTVVYGPNESGKSTWHAALYLGLCGIRRAQGQSIDTRELTERHKPWDLDGWSVSTTIKLEDGRRVELNQDLQNRAHCSAVDADLGRDCSNEIINEGSPDGSRWLGLDRRSFRNTACVRQVEIQEVLHNADALQEHLQRAAATAGTDATAAAAIARLEEFRRENIGQDRRNSTKPLRRATVRATDTQSRLERARNEHRRYIEMVGQVESAEGTLSETRASRVALEAGIAHAEVADLERKVSRARELAGLVPEAPGSLAGADDMSQEVATAVSGWRNRPDAVILVGASSAELRSQLDRLPPAPDGDVEPDTTVKRAERDWHESLANLRHHESQRVQEIPAPQTGGLTEQQLRDAVRDLTLPPPDIDPGLEARRDHTQAQLQSLDRRRWPIVPLAGAALTASLGIGLMFVILPAGLLLLAAAALVFFFSLRRRGQGARAELLEKLRQIESEFGTMLFQAQEVARKRALAGAVLSEHGLPIEVEALGKLADRVRAAEQARPGVRLWEDEHQRLSGELGERLSEVRKVIRAREAVGVEDVDKALEIYKLACRNRRQQAEESAKRPALTSALESREQAEKAAGESEKARVVAEREVQRVAQLVVPGGGAPDEMVAKLENWLEGHSESMRQREQRGKQWQELQTLLDGRTLEDLEVRLEEQRGRALEMSSAAALDSRETVDNARKRLERLRADEQTQVGDVERLKGELTEYSRNIASVPEAEEELSAATTELNRIRRLDGTVGNALTFLEEAQDRTHRSIAPLLKAALERWLPQVTGGRYVDARVDPETLHVTVRGADSPWRDARLLSHGTAEQVYLLLRVAMSEYLTAPGEKAPLALDDVTVQADVDRQEAILQVLKAISSERQVILFSQERDVYEWATQNLLEPRNRVISLRPDTIPA